MVLSRIPCLAFTLAATMSAPSALMASDPAAAPLPPTVPDGFEVTLAAGPPMVRFPICADFDDAGFLYVAESSGSNAKVEEQLEAKPHRILRMEDDDGDGIFDRSVVFADSLMIPQGVLCHDGALYCAAPPVIWKLVDTDADGVADERGVWFDGKTLTGCANDLHGPYLGPDGLLYWCKGGFAHQEHAPEGRRALSDRAAHIFRMRPDGSGFDSFLAGGMDNPVEIAWTRTGDLIFTSTFVNHPSAGKRDALVHGIYGGVYPKTHGVIDGLARTGELMAPMTHLGPAAPCGLLCYEAGSFGESFMGNLFACQFNLHSVTRHILVPHGSTYRTEDSDFMTSDSPDFHPTDVLADRDGSLIVIDTGGWYKLCCPTSQIAKPEVPGAIYRVRKREPTPPPKASPHDTETDEVWAWARRTDPSAREGLRKALSSTNETLAHAALHGVAVARDAGALPHILPLLAHRSPALRRAAATAVAHLRDPAAVPSLLAATALPSDRALDHALVHALIEIADPAATARGLGADNPPQTWRAALVALDQMDGHEATINQLREALESGHATVRETALWLYQINPQRSGELASYVAERLAAPDPGEDVVRSLTLFSDNDEVLAVMAAALLGDVTSTATKQAILEAAPSRETPPDFWAEAVGLALRKPALTPAAVRAAARSPSGGRHDSALLAIARDSTRGPALRLEALEGVAELPAPPGDDIFEFLLENLNLASARLFQRTELSAQQRERLAGALRAAGPLELPHLLGPFRPGGSEADGRRLLASLEQAAASASLGEEVITETFANFPEPVRDQAAKFARSLRPGLQEQRQQLAELETELPPGDRDRGHVVFNSPVTACLTCHGMGYRGGDLGPDLSKIGSVRTRRDLLEAIVFPSASLVRSYEPVTVTTRDGHRHLGVVRDQNATSITLGLAPGLDVPVARNNLESVGPAPASLMPAGLDKVLSPQELSDLVTFLESMK